MIKIRRSDIKWAVIGIIAIIALIILLIAALTGGDKKPSSTTKNTGTPAITTPSMVNTATPIPTQTPVPKLYMKVNADNLNVRDSASQSGEAVTSLKNGAVVEVIQKDAVAGWHKIKTSDGKIGYCKSEFLVDTVAPTQSASVSNSVSPTQSTTPTTGTGTYMEVNADTLNLREKPNTDEGTKVVATLPNGAIIKVLDKNAAEGWYKVQTKDGLTGYCKSEFLKASTTGWTT